jgi:GT2 family glycosyltransferase
MDLSIIIVTFNSFPYIRLCLRSILDQARDMDYELIIVDNDSKDETCEIIEKEFPQVILIQNGFNAGFAKANNLALRRAKGEFVILINPDTIWGRGDLKKAIGFLKEHPGVGALGCRIVLKDGSRQKSLGNFPTLMKELKETFYLPRLFPRSPWMSGVYIYDDFLSSRPVDWVSCTFFLGDRGLMSEVGFFDERYFMYYEDIDLSKRIRGKGREIYYYPEIEITHFQRWPSIIDFGESPYIYFNKYFGLWFAKKLRCILLLKTFLRIWIFFFLTLFTGRMNFRDKLRSYYQTFKFHLFNASEVIKGLKIEKGKKTNKNSNP